MPAHRSEMDIPEEIEVRDLALDPARSATTVPALIMETLDPTLVQSRAVRETHIKTLKILDDWIVEGVAARNSIGSVSRRTMSRSGSFSRCSRRGATSGCG